jgi:transcriptional regulator with XRE-family HTH domain
MSNVGDLGRRVAERRSELGLSRDTVAIRARMNPSYLETLEQSPSPQLSSSALFRLAAALETTAEVLTGEGRLGPPGRTSPTSRPTLDSLDREECTALIKAGGVGRVVFNEPRGPVAIPVNFRVLDDAVIFRTAPSAGLLQSLGGGQLSFEVDQIDDALAEGWSVLISGEAEVITDPVERILSQALDIAPWAGGDRGVYVRIVPNEVTGRRIRRRMKWDPS